MRATPVVLLAQWSVEQMLWSRRTLAMVPLAAAPVLLALVYRLGLALGVAEPSSGIGVFSTLVAAAGFQLAAPLLALVYATGVVADDEEAGTLAYFLTRPVRRSELLAGKMLGSFALTLALFLPALVVTFYVVLAPSGIEEVGAGFPVLLRHLFAAVLAVAAYNGLFAFAGTALSRPLLAGLFFLYGWQAAASVVPGAIRYFTVTHYLQALLPRESLEGAISEWLSGRPSKAAAIAALLIISAVSHWGAVRLFGRKEL